VPRRTLLCLLVATTSWFHPIALSAATISVGAQIPVSAGVFVIPINIVAGTSVVSWEFDLLYDPDDVQVNVACDPFAGDSFCSLFTGPVTEGDFLDSGSPFNVLNPGFVVLDASLAQTGVLLGVNGAYGGFPPSPSGDGVLAYVEFLRIGDGASLIAVRNAAVTQVPEPSTLALMATAVFLADRRRRCRHQEHR
jgi:hypothetical protein